MPRDTTGSEVYKDKRGQFRWRRTLQDGTVVGRSSESYARRADAEESMNRAPTGRDRWEFYTDRRGQHRWRCTASHGQLIGASPAGYPSKKKAQENAALNGWGG